MIVRAEDITPQPWKNGGGTTRDLMVDAPDWRWRISLADIDRDGPFSPYPGVERWFAVVEGAGVELTVDGIASVIKPHDPALWFDGERAPSCRLLDGPTRDLNLLLRADLGVRGVMRRAGAGVIWSEDWPLRGHFDMATRTLAWNLPPGPLPPRGVGYWIGVAP